MKTRISKLDFGNGIHRYIIAHKEHWWSRWHYVMDGEYPRLFTFFEQIGKDYLDTWLDKQEYHSKAIECSDLHEAFVEGFKSAMLKARGWVEKESASSMAEENGKDFIEYMMEE